MAIDRDIMNKRTVPGQGTGPVGMNEPTFRMQMPRLASVLDRMAPMPMPAPMPMQPGPRFQPPMEPYRPPPGMTPFNPEDLRPPPGMGPFRQQPFPDQMPRGDRFRDFMMPAAATIDPSDYRTILKMIEQGLDTEDYMNRGGIASLLQ